MRRMRWQWRLTSGASRPAGWMISSGRWESRPGSASLRSPGSASASTKQSGRFRLAVWSASPPIYLSGRHVSSWLLRQRAGGAMAVVRQRCPSIGLDETRPSWDDDRCTVPASSPNVHGRCGFSRSRLAAVRASAGGGDRRRIAEVLGQVALRWVRDRRTMVVCRNGAITSSTANNRRRSINPERDTARRRLSRPTGSQRGMIRPAEATEPRGRDRGQRSTGSRSGRPLRRFGGTRRCPSSRRMPHAEARLAGIASKHGGILGFESCCAKDDAGKSWPRNEGRTRCPAHRARAGAALSRQRTAGAANPPYGRLALHPCLRRRLHRRLLLARLSDALHDASYQLGLLGREDRPQPAAGRADDYRPGRPGMDCAVLLGA